MIPYSRPKHSDLYTLSQSKLLENHTLHSGTYLYSPYMAVPPILPPPPPGLSLGFEKVKHHFSLISTKWRFFFIFVTIRAKSYSAMFAFFLFIQFILIWLFWFAEFAEKLIDTTASRLTEHFVRNKEKMAWNFVLSGYRIWEWKVNKLMSDALLKDAQHAWVDLWITAAEIRRTDNEDGVMLKGKSNIRVFLP